MFFRPLAKGRMAGLTFLLGISLALLPADLRAAVADGGEDANPYTVIMEKNIFHLQPPPPPPEPEKPKVELPSVKLTGFVNIGEKHKVLFISEPKDKKESVAYYSLSEGERSGDGKLELVKIHPNQQAVDVLNEGVPVTLTIKDDSLAAGGAPAPTPATAGEPPPPQRMHPGGMPGRPMFRQGNADGMVPGFPAAFSNPMRRRNMMAPPQP